MTALSRAAAAVLAFAVWWWSKPTLGTVMVLAVVVAAMTVLVWLHARSVS